jgi:uncharacterized protein (TIGR02996 family)
MRTFEFHDGKSGKFWNIELQGHKFTVTFGKLGAKGQTQTKEFADAAAAQKAHDKLVKEKLAKGYVETTATPSAGGAALRQALEDALAADFDDVGAHMAYADWLMEQGDPKGEFIQVQLALEDESRSKKERDKLRQREKALLRQHGRQWLGSLAEHLIDWKGVELPPHNAEWRRLFAEAFEQAELKEVEADLRSWRQPYYAFQFARGWLTALGVGRLTEEFAGVLARAPAARLLRRLSVPTGADTGDRIIVPPLAPFAEAAWVANLRAFQIGHPQDACYVGAEGAVDVIGRMTRLEELRLFAHHVETERLFALESLGHLRVLEVNHLAEYPLEVLAGNAALKDLEELSLWPHMVEPFDERRVYITAEGARALIRSPHLPRLRVLELRNSALGDEGCAEIVRSGLLKRLKVLNLTNGLVTDAGARALAACPDLKDLELLNVSGNMLTEAGLAALRATGPRVESSRQYGEVPLDEVSYVWEGDME